MFTYTDNTLGYKLYAYNTCRFSLFLFFIYLLDLNYFPRFIVRYCKLSASNDSQPTRDVLTCAHLIINHANNKFTDTASVRRFDSGKSLHIPGLSESRLHMSSHISDSDISMQVYIVREVI